MRFELQSHMQNTVMKFTVIHEFGRAGGMKNGARRRVRRANLKA
jgi:hypothetical protein